MLKGRTCRGLSFPAKIVGPVYIYIYNFRHVLASKARGTNPHTIQVETGACGRNSCIMRKKYKEDCAGGGSN